jgi:membrane-bound serine protease (ClpP class)
MTIVYTYPLQAFMGIILLMIKKQFRVGWLSFVIALAALTLSAQGLFAQASREALVLTLDGALTPALKAYLQRGISRAEQDGAALVIVQINTPGGQIDLMEDMKDAIRGSRVPVVVFVAPRGAMAGSAGTVITLAGHAVAMAPETIIGAASPVGGQGEDLGATEQAKVKEALKATVRTLAEHRGDKAVALAESTIDTAKAATVDEAYAAGLIDFRAADIPDLLRQLNGFKVELNGQTVTLDTNGLQVVDLSINLLETLLNILTNPNVVFLLLALGTQAILIEITNPGAWVPGFVGVVSLALAFYGMGVLSVNWFGIIFIGLAFVLFILDIKTPTHGALTLAGAGSLIAGALVLFNSPGTPEFFRVSVPLVVITSGTVALGFAVILAFALRAQRRPQVMGIETLVGQSGEARSASAVQVASELWSAEAESGQLEPGDKVEVVGVRGLKVVVRKTA